MAGRIRSIKPEMLEDAVTAGLSDGAYRLFIGVILLADDAGRLRAAPGYLTAQVFWNTPEGSTRAREDVARLLAELVGASLVHTYRVRGQEYGVIRNWLKHQRIDHPSKPRIPGPDEADAPNSQEVPPPAPIHREPSRESRETVASPRETLAPDRDLDQDQDTDTPPTPSRQASGGPGVSVESAQTAERPMPVVSCPTVEHALNPDPAEFRWALARALGTNELTAASRGEDQKLQDVLRGLWGQGFAPTLWPDAGAFLAAGGLRAKNIAGPDVGWFLRGRGANLRWLVTATTAWLAAGRPALDAQGRHVVAKPATATAAPSAAKPGDITRQRRLDLDRAKAEWDARKAAEAASNVVELRPTGTEASRG